MPKEFNFKMNKFEINLSFEKDYNNIKGSPFFVKFVEEKTISYKENDITYYFKPTKVFKTKNRILYYSDKKGKITLYDNTNKVLILKEEKIKFENPIDIIAYEDYLYLISENPTNNFSKREDMLNKINNNLSITQIDLKEKTLVSTLEFYKKYEGTGCFFTIVSNNKPLVCFINHFDEKGCYHQVENKENKELPRTFKELFNKIKDNRINYDFSKNPLIFIELTDKISLKNPNECGLTKLEILLKEKEKQTNESL